MHYFTFDDARTTAEFTHGIKLPMAPFLGVVAVEPAGDDPVSAILSGAYGGNLVLRDLTAGSHLFLPVAKDLHKDVPLRGPLGETETTWIVIGFDASLDNALVACLRETIMWLSAAAQIAEPEVYALASMAVSFRVTQYANQTGSAYSSIPAKAVHAVIPKSVFPAEIQGRIGAWLRPQEATA